MNIRCGAAAHAALAAIVVAWAGGRLEAGRVCFEGVSVDLPEGWRPIDLGEATAAAWGRASSSGLDANLVVDVHPRETPAHRGLASGDRQAIERAVRAAPGLSGFRLLDHRIVEVDGLPAHRLRGRTEMEGRAMEQLLLFVPGARTVLITFSWEEGRGAEEDFDVIARSARVERGPESSRENDGGNLAMVLGILAGAALASRKLVRR